MKRLSIVITHLVAFAAIAHAERKPKPQGGGRTTHSARLGDMQITLVAARIASDQESQDYWRIPPAGRKVVLVFLRMKNVARYPSCSFLDEWLRVKQGYEYHRFISSKLQAPWDSLNNVTYATIGTSIGNQRAGPARAAWNFQTLPAIHIDACPRISLGLPFRGGAATHEVR